MKFGYFDNSKKEYMITTAQTPYPWINYLGNREFFSLISNTAGGYCFFKDACSGRILQHRHNSVPLDNCGRYFFIRENDDFWSPGWKPLKRGLTEYQCRHGLGYTIIKGVRNGLAVETLYFVPLHNNCEIHRLTLTNTSDKAKKITLFSYVEFSLCNDQNKVAGFLPDLNIAEMEVDGSVIYHKTGYRKHSNHFAFYSVNRQISGFDTDRDVFLGRYNGLDNPDVISDGKSKNSIVDNCSPIASHSLNISIGPKESTELIFVLGYVENDPDDKWESKGVINKKNAKAIINNYFTITNVDKAFDELKAYWEDQLSGFSFVSVDEKLNQVVNIWSQYQWAVHFNLAHTSGCFDSGIDNSIRFRDFNHNTAGFVHFMTDQARCRIIDLASAQSENGDTDQASHLPANKVDEALWLTYSVAAYIKETGDWTILDEKIPFKNNTLTAKPLLDHLSRSFNNVVNSRGLHGLPVSRQDKKSELVHSAGLFVNIGNEYVKILQSKGKKQEADTARKHIDQMIQAIKTHCWDGEWFIYAYDDAGKRVGSSECEEGKIFIEPQGWCIMAGIGAEDGLGKKAMDSVRKFLDTAHGLLTLDPPFSDYCASLEEITSMLPGYGKNGGILCYNNALIIIAETLLGQGDSAFEHLKKITPAYLEDASDLHKLEPYVFSQEIKGKDSKHPGELKNSWSNETAAWVFITISRWILGIRPDFNGLVVDPCIPSDWNGFTVTRKFRGSIYKITVKNPSHICKGVKTLIIDGITVQEKNIPVFSDGKVHEIEAIMG
ncbi:MAG: glycosyl transferase [Fibrobacter sp.]|nr:glycosyl transferase [Fibrobacter sp.]